MLDGVANRWALRGGRTIVPTPATVGELQRVHTQGHLERMAATAGQSVMLDADTFTSPDSYDIARLAAGAAVQAADHAVTEREAAVALVRPPGHHAEPDRAMGFCLFNNVAVAAAAMRARGLERVAIVDIDVHHGNGTQAMFYDDPHVLYVSTHQYPFYPGTGAADEIGAGDGAGFTVNVPMEAGCVDDDYTLVYRTIVIPVLDQFAPQLILVSAGYDAHERDPLASMRVTTEGYGDDCSATFGRRRPPWCAGDGHGRRLRFAVADCVPGTVGGRAEWQPRCPSCDNGRRRARRAGRRRRPHVPQAILASSVARAAQYRRFRCRTRSNLAVSATAITAMTPA